MGRDIYFSGYFEIEPPLSEAHVEEIRALFNSQMPPKVEDTPGYHTPWLSSDDGWQLEASEEPGRWYGFEEWLRWHLKHQLVPWGHTVNGRVYWQGDEPEDAGVLVVRDNILTVYNALRIYVDEDGNRLEEEEA